MFIIRLKILQLLRMLLANDFWFWLFNHHMLTKHLLHFPTEISFFVEDSKNVLKINDAPSKTKCFLIDLYFLN